MFILRLVARLRGPGEPSRASSGFCEEHPPTKEFDAMLDGAELAERELEKIRARIRYY